MKKLLISLFLLLGTAVLAQAEESVHTKILFHDHRDMGRGFGTAGWVILPDITNAGRALFIAGPRYDNKHWWVEVMVGAVVGKNAVGQADRTWLIDIRFSPPPLGKHFTHWTNIEWVDLFKVKSGRYYLYYQLDANLPLGLGKIGIETENTFKPEPEEDSLSFGPHLVLVVGNSMRVSFVYQRHQRVKDKPRDNQWWFRTLVDL